ncbi:hypothetical protein [Tenacibaculum maritimum]|uniref:hypothetical protein n=1 Tax=Tenacibaculum maritimum TaxID=107401 RepID=UPI0012E6AFBD|nr:hypothetical protein [Tenacibaculum maritimum]CAA0193903.1 conserved exported hypothetical protein [Tenacibaculum maritimum]
MKRVILAIGLLVFTGIFTSCTDIAEEVEKNAKFEKRSFTNPGEDGTITDTDPDDDGEG